MCIVPNRAQNIAVTTWLSFFKKKKIKWNNYLILIAVLFFFCEIDFELLVSQDNSNSMTWNWQLKGWPEMKSWNLFQIISVTAITNVTGVQYFPVTSPRENNWKLFHVFDVIPCNIMNYLYTHQSKRCMIITYTNLNQILLGHYWEVWVAWMNIKINKLLIQ